jgi:hypothetical protein
MLGLVPCETMTNTLYRTGAIIFGRLSARAPLAAPYGSRSVDVLAEAAQRLVSAMRRRPASTATQSRSDTILLGAPHCGL